MSNDHLPNELEAITNDITKLLEDWGKQLAKSIIFKWYQDPDEPIEFTGSINPEEKKKFKELGEMTVYSGEVLQKQYSAVEGMFTEKDRLNAEYQRQTNISKKGVLLKNMTDHLRTTEDAIRSAKNVNTADLVARNEFTEYVLELEKEGKVKLDKSMSTRMQNEFVEINETLFDRI
jgi:hypothetical protein